MALIGDFSGLLDFGLVGFLALVNSGSVDFWALGSLEIFGVGGFRVCKILKHSLLGPHFGCV